MDRRPNFRKPSGTSVDGFIPNRKGRLIAEPFKRYPISNRLQPSSPEIGQETQNQKLQKLGHSKGALDSHKILKKTAPVAQAPAGVTWNPRIQDPSSVVLTRDKDRKSKELKKHLGRKHSWKKIVKRSALALVSIGIIVGGYVGFKFFHNIDKVFGGSIFSNIGSLFDSTTLKGENSGRVNILLAGDSSDQLGHGGADLTDSILVLSINTQNNTALLLSIPRDLWVYIPGLSTYQKINAANDDTSFSGNGYPSGGMGQLQEIVQTDLGIPIDYYALSDYGAFRDAVNAVGGVTIDIQSPDPRGLYDPNASLKLPNGEVTLNGQEALNLARARGDGYGSYGFPDSDFDRTAHQRQIFTAIVAKAQTIGVLANPVKIGDLFNAIGNNVQTNLSLQDVLKLVQITKNINLNNIKSYAYCSTLTVGQEGCTKPILTDYTDPSSGAEALIPTAGMNDYSQLQLYYESLTSNNPVVKEAASAVILNGGNINGLAKDYENILIPKGVNVTTIADAPSLYPTTEIMDDSGDKDPATKSMLISEFGDNIIPNNPAINTTGANFVIILGENESVPSN